MEEGCCCVVWGGYFWEVVLFAEGVCGGVFLYVWVYWGVGGGYFCCHASLMVYSFLRMLEDSSFFWNFFAVEMALFRVLRAIFFLFRRKRHSAACSWCVGFSGCREEERR